MAVGDDSFNQPKDVVFLTQGDAKDAKAQKRIAVLLEDALEFLQYTARTDDYFVGYSLPEVIHERLVVIGKKDADEDPNSFTSQGLGGRPTLMARLARLELLLLGDGKSEGAIAMAKKIKNPIDLTEKEEEPGQS